MKYKVVFREIAREHAKAAARYIAEQADAGTVHIFDVRHQAQDEKGNSHKDR